MRNREIFARTYGVRCSSHIGRHFERESAVCQDEWLSALRSRLDFSWLQIALIFELKVMQGVLAWLESAFLIGNVAYLGQRGSESYHHHLTRNVD